ncbi:MAG TPA: acyl-CoA dehydrogenase family protein [Acidimicrobiales bacterium]|nr:acyl-CoA dehydrogenase family protein [Acidimicrobiales bacterium]
MDLELTADQQALAESVRAFVDAECPMALIRQVVEEGKAADELWAGMVALDWPALTVPEEDGGIGLGPVELSVVAEELGRVLAPVPFLATAAQFVPAVRAAGTPEQRRRFLGAVASGGLVGTLACAEAAGGLDPARIATTATPVAGGWRLQGEKRDVFDAGWADEIVVAARLGGTEGTDGIGLFVVPAESVEIAPVHSLDATRQLATVGLDGVEVAADRALGEPGTSGPALVQAVNEATTALAAEMVGTSQAIFDIVHAYVGEREQFGVKIGSFQAMKHKLANMYVALESARAVAYFAAAALDEHDARAQAAVWMAKASAGDCQKLIAQEGIQSLGGIGYTWEHDMHLYVKRQKAQAALFGSGGEHRAKLAVHLGLDAPGSGGPDPGAGGEAD